MNTVSTSASLAKHAPISYFATAKGELLMGGIPLHRLVARVGQTPFYAYDRGAIAARIAELKSALPQGIRLHYAMKANPMPELVCHLATLVDGIDVASAGEMQVALNAGASAHDVSFAGPGKRDDELHQAVAAGVLINVESFREIPILARASHALGVPARVAVRVNPDFELKSAGMKMGGGPKPFGVDAEEVPGLLRTIAEAGLEFEGFHLFAGSQNLKAEAIAEAQTKSYELALRLADAAPSPVKVLNLGGGFGIPYFAGEHPLALGLIAENLARLLDAASSALPSAALVLELGRYLVGEAGVYVSRITDKKVSRGHTFLVTDGGLHHHLSASGNFGQVIRKNYPVVIGNRMAEPPVSAVSVVGPLCTPLDIIADRVMLPDAQPGDLVVVFQSGAYGASASPQGFLGHPTVKEILV